LAEIEPTVSPGLDEADWAVWLGEVPGDRAALLRAPADDVVRVRRHPAADMFRRHLGVTP
jgi:hypothetical protein